VGVGQIAQGDERDLEELECNCDGLRRLTSTEDQALRYLGGGLRRSEISAALGISARTVGDSLTVAKEKLSARSLVHAAVLQRLLATQCFGAAKRS
jgi:DNA-binding CsgD family transcriptional regulator